MALHKDKNGNLHDDMDGAALGFFPQDLGPYVSVTDAEADAIRAANVPSIGVLKAASIEQVKELRRVVFATLAGLQSEALASGDTITASGIIPVQEALRNLTQTDLSACQTQADIDAAFLNAWNAIVATTPDGVKTAFNGVL